MTSPVDSSATPYVYRGSMVFIAEPKPSAPCPVLPSPTLLWAARVCTIMLLLSLSLSLLPTLPTLGVSSQPFTQATALSFPNFPKSDPKSEPTNPYVNSSKNKQMGYANPLPRP